MQMEYNEWYEVHWRKPDNDSDEPTSGIVKYETEGIAWDEFDTMTCDPDIQTAILFRQTTVELSRHAKARNAHARME